MHDIEEIKRRRIQEIQEKNEEAINIQQQFKQLEDSAKNFLDKEALSRYSNIKIAHPEMAIKAISIIYQAVQSGYLKKRLNDNEFKSMLIQIQDEEKKFKFIRK